MHLLYIKDEYFNKWSFWYRGNLPKFIYESIWKITWKKKQSRQFSTKKTFVYILRLKHRLEVGLK